MTTTAPTSLSSMSKDDMLRIHNWLTLAAAHAAVERAEARGVDARVQLCALVPVQADR